MNPYKFWTKFILKEIIYTRFSWRDVLAIRQRLIYLQRVWNEFHSLSNFVFDGWQAITWCNLLISRLLVDCKCQVNISFQFFRPYSLPFCVRLLTCLSKACHSLNFSSFTSQSSIFSSYFYESPKGCVSGSNRNFSTF